MNLNEVRATRHDHFQAAEKLVMAARKAGKDLVGAELEQYQTHINEIKNLDALIERCESFKGITPRNQQTRPVIPGIPILAPEKAPAAMGIDTEGRALPIFNKGQSLEAFLRQQHGIMPDGEVTLGALVRAMALGGGSPAVRNALSEGTDSAGGVTVPLILSSQLIDALRARSTVFQAGARTLVLDTAKTTIARIDSDPTATWRAENASVAVSDMTFSPVVFAPKTLAVIVTASRELVEDSLNLTEALQMSLSASFAAEVDRVALIGAGTGSEPKGVSKVTGIGSYSMGTNGAALTNYDPFCEALAILQTANAMDPTACIMHPRTAKEINLLKDSQNRPLSRPAALEKLPFLVTSKLSITETQGTSNAASRVILGNFPELIVGMRASLRIEMLREKYADTLAYGFLAWIRADVNVAHAASFCNIVGVN